MEANMQSTIAKAYGKPVQARLRENELELLDEWRRKQKNIPTRPEAIRQLIRLIQHQLLADQT
jgi:hypothetical protein